MNKKEKKIVLLKAFFSYGLWHIWSAFSDCSSSYYRTANNEQELMKIMYDDGYRLICQNRDGVYYFELK